jgi:hypothetical protein
MEKSQSDRIPLARYVKVVRKGDQNLAVTSWFDSDVSCSSSFKINETTFCLLKRSILINRKRVIYSLFFCLNNDENRYFIFFRLTLTDGCSDILFDKRIKGEVE